MTVPFVSARGAGDLTPGVSYERLAISAKTKLHPTTTATSHNRRVRVGGRIAAPQASA